MSISDLLESIREHMEADDLEEAGLPLDTLIQGRVAGAEKALKALQSAVAKYQKNPQKYAPQLGNAKEAARTLMQVGKALLHTLDKAS